MTSLPSLMTHPPAGYRARQLPSPVSSTWGNNGSETNSCGNTEVQSLADMHSGQCLIGRQSTSWENQWNPIEHKHLFNENFTPPSTRASSAVPSLRSRNASPASSSGSRRHSLANDRTHYSGVTKQKHSNKNAAERKRRNVHGNWIEKMESLNKEAGFVGKPMTKHNRNSSKNGDSSRAGLTCSKEWTLETFFNNYLILQEDCRKLREKNSCQHEEINAIRKVLLPGQTTSSRSSDRAGNDLRAKL